MSGPQPRWRFVRTRAAAGGFSLIELLVAITVGLLIVSAIGFIFVASRQTQRTGDGMARVQETARTSSLILDSSLRLAGYLPDPRNQIDPTAIFAAPRKAVSGGHASAPPWKGIANAVATADYVAVSFLGNDDQTLRTCLGDLLPGNMRAFEVFFLSQQAGDDTPSLSCATEVTPALAPPATVTLNRNEPIQQGVTGLDILFGLDTDGDLNTDRYFDAAGVAAADIGEAVKADNWNHVTSIEVTLGVQSEIVERSQTGVLVVSGRLNRPLRQTIALRNRLLP